MSWEAIFADSHFEPSNYTLPIGDAAAANNNINLAPLQYVTDIQPVGVTYHRLVFPEKKEYVVTALTDDGVDVEELLDQVREAALDDYYALLGLEEKGLAATEQDINKNWKHINLFLHPDKAEPQKKAEAEVRFKQCSKAYATLTTPADRIDYDSHWRFDDAIPSATAGQASAEEFLRVYTPVFERNARFSKNKPIPSIGGVDATEKQLKQFYDFWLSFASWREFPQGDTEKIGSSAARDERRRAEQKNKKGRETLKAAEMKRVRLLAERAQASDPRLKAIKAAKGPGKAAAAAATSPAAAKAAAVVGKPGAKGLPAGLAAKQQANIAAKQAEQEKKVQEKTISDAKSRLRGALLNELSMIEKKPLIEEVVKQLTVDLEACQKINQVLLTRGYNDVQGKNGRGVLEIPAVVNIINAAEGKAPVSEKKEGKEWTAQETQ